MGKLSPVCCLIVISVSLYNCAKIKSGDDNSEPPKDVVSKMAPESDAEDYQVIMKQLEVERIMRECNATYPIQMSFMDSLQESGSFPDEIEKTPKCYIRCYLEMLRVLTEDGVDTERAAAVLPVERNGKTMDDVAAMAGTCSADRRESCQCERAYNFLKCIMEMEIEKYQN